MVTETPPCRPAGPWQFNEPGLDEAASVATRLVDLDRQLSERCWRAFDAQPHTHLSTVNAYASMVLSGMDARRANPASTSYDPSISDQERALLIGVLNALSLLQIRAFHLPFVTRENWYRTATIEQAHRWWRQQLEHELSFSRLKHLPAAWSQTLNASDLEAMYAEDSAPGLEVLNCVSLHFDLIARQPQHSAGALFSRWYTEMCLRGVGIRTCGIWSLGRALRGEASPIYDRAPVRSARRGCDLALLSLLVASMTRHRDRLDAPHTRTVQQDPPEHCAGATKGGTGDGHPSVL